MAVTEMLITTISIFGEDIVRKRHLCFVYRLLLFLLCINCKIIKHRKV